MTRAALALLLLSITAEARAEGERKVRVVSPSGTTEEVSALMQRLQAELNASGFSVEHKRYTWLSLNEMVDDAAGHPDFAGTITVARGPEGPLIDVWIADRHTGRTVGRRVEGTGSEQLSVRAVEALRAGLIEISVVAAPAPADEPEPEAEPEPDKVAVIEPIEPVPTLEQPRFRVSSGAAFLISSDTLGGAVGPQLRFASELGRGWWAGAQLVAPIWGGESQNVSVSQALTQAELSFVLPFSARMQLVSTLGLGMYWAGHGGQGVTRADTTFSAMGSAGVGVGFELSTEAYVLWDIQGMFFAPTPEVVVANRGQAGPGTPAFLSSLGLNVHF
jgi:hypothetical protein